MNVENMQTGEQEEAVIEPIEGADFKIVKKREDPV